MTTVNLSEQSVAEGTNVEQDTYHNLLRKADLVKLLSSIADKFSCKVGTFSTSSKDNMNIGISLWLKSVLKDRSPMMKTIYLSLNNAAQTLFPYREEYMSTPSSKTCINSNFNTSVCRILKSSRHRQSGS